MGSAFADGIEPSEMRSETQPEERSARSDFSWKLLLLGMVGGAVLEVAGPEWTRQLFHAISLSGFAGISSVLAALVAAIVAHEAGHLFMALLLDFQVIGGSFGPWRVSRRNGEWTCRFAPRNWFMASVSAIPRSLRAWRWRMLAVVAAGPAATLVSGVAAGSTLLLCSTLGWTANFLATFAQLSFFLFTLGLVPNGTKARVRNDARLFCVFWQNSSDAEVILAWHQAIQSK
jgi:hypothetical protein